MTWPFAAHLRLRALSLSTRTEVAPGCACVNGRRKKPVEATARKDQLAISRSEGPRDGSKEGDLRSGLPAKAGPQLRPCTIPAVAPHLASAQAARLTTW